MKFLEHQSRVGKLGARAHFNSLSEQEKKNWHVAGGKSGGKNTAINKIGIHNPKVREKTKKAVSAAIKNTVELWHPDAPETVTNRNSSGYVSGWSVRVKPDSEKFHEYLKLGYIFRQSKHK